ncbi:MAG: MATE family efflux transporter [Clostridia bacterium]|nr:MATE family efflux transporter [Clostridia bacterium]
MQPLKTMTSGSPARLIFLFALPLMLGNIFQQCYTVVDTIIVGRGVGMDALAALGSVDWLNWMILGIVMGFTQGFSVRMAQKFGEGDKIGLRRTIGLAARLTIIITLITAVLAQVLLPLFLHLLRVPAELRPMSELYIRILFAGVPCLMFYNFTSSVIRAVGDGRTPLIAMIAASITNIVLDSAAVFGLGWGIAGAAAATVFSQALAGTICAVKIWRTPDLRFTRADMKPDRKITAELLKLGYPVSIQYTIIHIGGMIVQSVVNGFGTVFIAGFTATNKLYGLLEICAISYGNAVTTYVGQNVGAGQFDRVKKGVNAALLISALTSAVISTVMITFGRQITMLFISSDSPAEEAAAGEIAYQYLFLMSAFLLVLYLLYIYSNALRGMGNTIIPMFSGAAEFVMRVGVALLVGLAGLPENWIFAAEFSAWTGATILLSISYYICIRRLKP